MRRALAAGLMLLWAGAGLAGEIEIERFEAPDAYVARWKEGVVALERSDGRRAVSAITPGDGRPVLVAKRRPFEPPLDLSGKFPRVWLKVGDVSRLAGMEFRLSSDGLGDDYFSFRVPVYADAEYNWIHSGEWVALTLPFGEARATGRPDRAAIDSIGWMLGDRGSPERLQPLKAWWGGMSAVDAPAAGIVSFTFDDGYDEHVEVAAPILAEHGFRATAYVMPEQVGAVGYMDAEELARLRDRYGWDVAAHHLEPFTGLAEAEVERRMLGLKRWLAARGFAAEHLAFPLGKQDGPVLALARRHFATGRLASSGPETLPPSDPLRLRTVNVTRTTPPGEIAAAAHRARDHGEWLILMFHFLEPAPEWETQYAVSGFREAVARVAATGVRVRKVSEVFEALGAPASPP